MINIKLKMLLFFDISKEIIKSKDYCYGESESRHFIFCLFCSLILVSYLSKPNKNRKTPKIK
jgi:hypothetical protein